MLEEAKWMRRVNLKIPEVLHIVTIANVKKTYSQLLVSQCTQLALGQGLGHVACVL
jgi:hypothetical protein